MAALKGRKTKGRIFTRGKSKRYYLQYYVNGQEIKRALKNPDGQPVKNMREAKAARDLELAPLAATDEVQRRQQAVAALKTAEDVALAAEAAARPKLALADAWAQYLQSQERPDSSDSTLRQYKCQWRIFTKWAATHGVVNMEDVTTDHAASYASYLQNERGVTRGTFNKHTRLLKLVFRVLGESTGIAVNPFDKIKSKTDTQSGRKELSFDRLAEICDAAEGEMKLLFFIGAYTGQRMGDCCTLTWDEIDLRRGQILHTPRKTARRKPEPLLIPIHSSLRNMLEAIPKAERSGYVLPDLAAEYLAHRHNVARTIQNLLIECGIQIHKPGTGRGTGKRAVVQYGFHSLRHNAVSLLLEAGAPVSIVQAIVGHNSTAMTGKYTHVSRRELTRAIGSMPTLEQMANREQPEVKQLPAHEPERAALIEAAGALPIERVRELLGIIGRYDHE